MMCFRLWRARHDLGNDHWIDLEPVSFGLGDDSWHIEGDPAQWLDTVVLIGAAVLACGALWLYLRQAVPAAARRYVDAKVDRARAGA